MNNTLKTATACLVMLIMMSFTDTNKNAFIGSYGVSDSNPAAIRLSLNADNTFSYQDLSVSDKKIQVSGRWMQKGGKVVLTASDAAVKFHSVWSFSEQGRVAKSRKGLAFYRLCKLDN